MNAEQLEQLKNDCRQFVTTGDRRALSALKKLRSFAKATKDPALFGFAEYYAANYDHDRGTYESARKHLVLAVRHLLRSNDRELLARAYNYFGVDAAENGALDIACSYYMAALRCVEDRKESTAKGLALLNLSNLFSKMGYFARARRYFRKGMRLIQQTPSDPFYVRNMIVALASDGLNSIAMGEVANAEKTFRKMRRIYDGTEATQLLDAKMLCDVFETRLALELGDLAFVKTQAKALSDALEHDLSPHTSLDDFSELLRTMMRRGFLKEAGRIVASIRPRVISGGVIYTMHLLAELRADYYERIGNKEALTACLEEQNLLLLRMQAEQKKLYRHSIDMVRLVGELREEEQAVRRENRRLQEEAETDALTGVPNRYAIEREMGAAFENAYGTKTRLGVGLLDINDFKKYNDSFGHAAGDACLVLLGRALKKLAARENFFCARYGGDEFLIIYRNMTDDEIKSKAKELSDALSSMKITLRNKTINYRLTISQGVCNDIPVKKAKPWDYLSAADAALYELKHNRTASLEDDALLLRTLPDVYR